MAITIANLTANVATDASNVVTGTGVFDDMMETVNAHMAAQFNLGRITGSDYATVYLTAMQATVQQAVAYTVGMQKGNAEESLLYLLSKLKGLNGMQIRNILKLFWMLGVLIFLQQV